MRHPRLLALGLGLALALPLTAFASDDPMRPPVTPIRAGKIGLVGDSTTAVHGGWGGAFCDRHVASSLACTNLARGGRSTCNYRAEGSWNIALHEIRAAGAHPVLVTPLTRRQFEAGHLLDDLAPWAEATRAVARELDVPLVDLHARSRALVQGMGPVLAMRTAQRPAAPEQITAAQGGTTIGTPPSAASATHAAAPAPVAAQDNAATEPMGQAKFAFDYTHLGPEGAALFAAIVADELAQQVPALRRNLIA